MHVPRNYIQKNDHINTSSKTDKLLQIVQSYFFETVIYFSGIYVQLLV